MAEPARDERHYYFHLAVEQMTDLNLYFYLDRCQYSCLRATCAGIKNGHLVARVSLDKIEHEPIVWGSEVNAYFTVRDAEIVHCHFTSKLVRMYNAPPDAMYLVFPLPRYLDHNQRRFSRRVGLNDEAAQGLGVWHGEFHGGDMENLPSLRWISLPREQCEIGEISANGMRLELLASGTYAKKLGVNDLVLLKGDFAPASKPCPIFVLGVVVRKMQDRDNENIVGAGCHFLSWRKVQDTAHSAWFKADAQEGVGMIAQWVSRNFHNLQM